MLRQLKIELNKNCDKNKARIMRGFFKTGKGEYGEKDIFLGIPVPLQRKIASRYIKISASQLENLIRSKYHEYRSVALIILTEKYKLAQGDQKERIFRFYVKNIYWVNSWDLVDLSAPKIVGGFLSDKNKDFLYKFATSKDMWVRRISIVSTLHFVRKGNFKDALKISEMLLDDENDLTQKAVGWVLREVGKKDKQVLESFLGRNYDKLARTTLRYAIERFSIKERNKK